MDMFFKQVFQNFADKIVSLLPQSPIVNSDFASLGAEFMGILNWFVPVGLCLDFLGSVLGCVGLFYLVMIILRLLRVIK